MFMYNNSSCTLSHVEYFNATYRKRAGWLAGMGSMQGHAGMHVHNI